MAVRQWFTEQNTADLTTADRAVLNRCGRNIWPVEHQPTRAELVVLRTVYRPGMTAGELAKAAEA